MDAYYVALFAQMYDEITDADIPSAVTMKNSTVSLTTGECQGVYCGSGGILVEDTVLTTKTDKEIYAEGYSLYSYGDITIKGDDTVINADDDYGIAADDGVLRIEGGKVDVCSTDVALTGGTALRSPVEPSPQALKKARLCWQRRASFRSKVRIPN